MAALPFAVFPQQTDGDVAEDKSLGRKWEFVHQVVLARSLENRIGLLLS
jgi:hypothetical protein